MRIVFELMTVLVMTLLIKGIAGRVLGIEYRMTDGRGSSAYVKNLVLWVLSLILANVFTYALERYLLR